MAPRQPDLIGIQLTIKPTQDSTLPSNYTYWLHAWFLDQIRQIDPHLSAELHDNQAEKAFTLSGFLGTTAPHNRNINFSNTNIYHCQITALHKTLCTALKNWQPPSTITLRNNTFQITQRQINLPATTYKALWDNTNLDDELNLSFLSATAFHKNGNHMPLPIPENLFHSYLRRWNIFSDYQFDPEEFLTWVREGVVLLRHNIRSSKVQPGKQGSVTGFMGSIQLGITNKALYQVDFSHLAHALVAAAPYFGTGHKVTFGLGQTRSGWEFIEASIQSKIQFSAKDTPKLSSAQTKLSANIPTKKSTSLPPVVKPTTPSIAIRRAATNARIKELLPIFLASKKRQGSDRAIKSAELWATIIARQEHGDSLKSIAVELDLPYDSVKKYSQLARKCLLAANLPG
jgi:CRISPR-associated endoribonuclease Cas6